MGRVKNFSIVPAGSIQGAGPTTGPWVKVPGDARVLFLKFSATAAVDVVVEQTADPSSAVRTSILKTFGNGVAGTDTAKTDFLPYVRAVVTGASTIGVTCDWEAAPFAPTVFIYDLRVKAGVDKVVSGWRKIPDEALSFYGVIDADACAATKTLDVKLQTADDAAGTNAADVTAGAFTQVTSAAAAKEAKGPFTNFKQPYVRASGSSTDFSKLTVAPAGANNDLVFTAKDAGTYGTQISIAYVADGVAGAETVTVTGFAIVVHVGATSTATQVKTAVDASVDAAALVTVANAAGNTGAGSVTAMPAASLTGGASYGVKIVAR